MIHWWFCVIICSQLEALLIGIANHLHLTKVTFGWLYPIYWLAMASMCFCWLYHVVSVVSLYPMKSQHIHKKWMVLFVMIAYMIPIVIPFTGWKLAVLLPPIIGVNPHLLFPLYLPIDDQILSGCTGNNRHPVLVSFLHLICIVYMEVSWNGGTPVIHFNRIFPDKPSLLGLPILRKAP